jgi:hypothetical protein
LDIEERSVGLLLLISARPCERKVRDSGTERAENEEQNRIVVGSRMNTHLLDSEPEADEGQPDENKRDRDTRRAHSISKSEEEKEKKSS